MKRILVTGGCGYIGSHTVLRLLEEGYDVVVIDSLINSSKESLSRVEKITNKKVSFYHSDLCYYADLKYIFEEIYKNGMSVDAVIHFAGLKSVGESVRYPLNYYRNNIQSSINLIDVMTEFNCTNLIFSSSATVYGIPKYNPVDEGFPVGGVTNPYGKTKLMVEEILSDIYNSNPAWNIVLLRYFNPTGAHPSGLIGEDPQGIPNNLVPYISRVADGSLDHVSVFGNDYPTPDGTGVRDYIHVLDLADGHIAALKRFESSTGLSIYNLGTGRGYSVLEMIRAFEKACGHAIPYVISPRRTGDVAECYANPSKAEKELNWKAVRSLEEMVADFWNWQTRNPYGYAIPDKNLALEAK